MMRLNLAEQRHRWSRQSASVRRCLNCHLTAIAAPHAPVAWRRGGVDYGDVRTASTPWCRPSRSP